MPRRIAKTRNVIYNAVYDQLVQNKGNRQHDKTLEELYQKCNCPKGLGKDNAKNPSYNVPTAFRVSNIIKNYVCYSRIQYNNDTSRYVNYLGKTQGQPGGSGMPPKNRLA